MRIVTWNMGYWQYRSHHEAAWEYLENALAPDIALLQETAPPASVAKHALIFNRVNVKQRTRPWGTAIYAPRLTIHEVPGVTEHSERLACGFVDVDPGTVGVASVHAYSDRVFPRLDSIIDDIEKALAGRPFIIGGDLNSARLAETVWPGYGHGPFWTRIDEGRFTDCCQLMHGREIQTFVREGVAHPWQDDHVVVTNDLADRIAAWDVVNVAEVKRLSDHLPVVVELDLAC